MGQHGQHVDALLVFPLADGVMTHLPRAVLETGGGHVTVEPHVAANHLMLGISKILAQVVEVPSSP